MWEIPAQSLYVERNFVRAFFIACALWKYLFINVSFHIVKSMYIIGRING